MSNTPHFAEAIAYSAAFWRYLSSCSRPTSAINSYSIQHEKQLFLIVAVCFPCLSAAGHRRFVCSFFIKNRGGVNKNIDLPFNAYWAGG
ncbi:hypothetical protein AB3X30_12815 [Raoultella terrigena]|uniref:hypothetical protein n=1 Tax=Raoultella terrigena TaxID=577 RepID=UPI00349FC178